MTLHTSKRTRLQPLSGPSAWRHPVRWIRWRRYVSRVGAVSAAFSRIKATSATRLSTYGMAALAVDAACYGGKRLREITGLEWDTLAVERGRELEWWHDYYGDAPSDSSSPDVSDD